MTRPPVPFSIPVDGRFELIRVLVVDDDQRVRAALRETLAMEADLLMVGEAPDVVTADAVTGAAEPFVALVDILLPDIESGLGLVRRLSRRAGCSVVAMSVRSSNREAAMVAGAVAFAEKGGDIDALLGAVRAAARPIGRTDDRRMPGLLSPERGQ